MNQSFFLSTSIVLIVVIAVLAFNYFRLKKAATQVDEQTFKAHMRKAQLIDVREKDAFNIGHINGARHLPMSQFKIRASSLRKDIPIYIYDNNGTVSARAAQQLYKLGYRQMYILSGGLKKGWTGKLKEKK